MAGALAPAVGSRGRLHPRTPRASAGRSQLAARSAVRDRRSEASAAHVTTIALVLALHRATRALRRQGARPGRPGSPSAADHRVRPQALARAWPAPRLFAPRSSSQASADRGRQGCRCRTTAVTTAVPAMCAPAPNTRPGLPRRGYGLRSRDEECSHPAGRLRCYWIPSWLFAR